MDSADNPPSGTTSDPSVPGTPQLRKSKRITSKVEAVLPKSINSSLPVVPQLISLEDLQRMEQFQQQIAQMNEKLAGDVLNLLVILNASFELINKFFNFCANQPNMNQMLNVVNLLNAKSEMSFSLPEMSSEAIFNVEAVLNGSQPQEGNNSQMSEFHHDASTSSSSLSKSKNRKKSLAKARSKYKCDKCSNTFSNFYNLDRHQKVHRDPKAYACDNCTERFKYREQLARHLLSEHQMDQLFPCTLCSMTFNRNGNLKRHMTIKHPIAIKEKD